MATASGAVEVWDTGERERLRSITTGELTEPPRGPVLVADPSGDRMAALSAATPITVWDIDSGDQISGPATISVIRSIVALRPDGNLVVELDSPDHGTVQLWHLPSGRLLASPPLVPDDGVTGLGFDPLFLLLGDQLMSRGGEPAVPELRLDPDAWFERLCEIQDRGFTVAEQAVVPEGTAMNVPCAGTLTGQQVNGSTSRPSPPGRRRSAGPHRSGLPRRVDGVREPAAGSSSSRA